MLRFIVSAAHIALLSCPTVSSLLLLLYFTRWANNIKE